jgi:hypothetical protein
MLLGTLQEKEKEKEKYIREWVAANTIRRCWLKCISDPAYMVCRNRLLREYSESPSLQV